MRELAVAVVLVSAGLAGCIGADEAAPAGGSIDPASETNTANASGVPGPLDFEGCTEHAGFFPVPASAYEDRLPEGFSLDPHPFVDDLPAGSEETATVSVASWRCQGTDGETTTAYANVKLGVTPPEKYQDESIDGYSIGLSGFTTNATFAEAFQAWGLTSYREASIDHQTADPPMAGLARTHALSDEAEVELATSVQGPREATDGGVVWTFHVDDGEVTGAVDITFTEVDYVWPGEATLDSSSEVATAPATAGDAIHYSGFGQTYEAADLPPREDS